ncbi:MAG: glycerol-3-phosphate acyltransferase [Dehalococcoidales bacterium]
MGNQILYITIVIICAYLIGSFPSAYIAGRLRKGIDIRQVGTRNMGAMNVFYQVGFVEGLLVLATDIGKGTAAIALARWLGVPMIAQLFAGVAAVIGHGFPIFLQFRGGRGGATCIGILVFLMPWSIPFYLAIFGISLPLTHYPTLSYSVAFLCFPFIAWLKYHSPELIIYSLGIVLLPAIKYIPRIKEMHASAGNWRHVFLRKNLKDRF